MKIGKYIFTTIILFLFFIKTTGLLQAKIKVVTGILPAKFLVEQIGKDKVEVISLIQPGTNAHSFTVSPQQMIYLSQAQLYLAYGFPFEKNLARKLRNINPKLKFIFLYQGLKRNFENTVHPDPHIWLSPIRMIFQARTVLQALESLSPQNKAYFRNNYKILIDKITALDLKIKNILDKAKGKTILIYHPSWRYFANDYGINLISIQREGKDPGPQSLIELFQKIKRMGIKTLFVQNTFKSNLPVTFAQNAGLKIIEVKDIFYNWFTEMEKMALLFSQNI